MFTNTRGTHVSGVTVITKKNIEKGLDFQTQVMTLNSPMNVIEAQLLCSVNGTFINANRKKGRSQIYSM